MEEYRYLIWLSLTWIPVIVLWVKFFDILKSYFKAGILINLLTFIPGAIWDYLAMDHGIWYFIKPLTGSLVFNYFPPEEFILIASMSWFCLTVTALFRKFFKEGVF